MTSKGSFCTDLLYPCKLVAAITNGRAARPILILEAKLISIAEGNPLWLVYIEVSL